MASKITKAFIEEAVKEPISDFTVGPGSNEGDNVAGSLLAIKATGKSGTVHNLVYKFMAQGDPMQANYAREFAIFRTEINLYTHLMPRLENLVKERSGESYPSLVPKFYGGFFDGENDYLLMEDVRAKGYIMQSKWTGLNLEEMCLIMKKLAEFHAMSYFCIKHEGERLFVEDEHLKSFTSNPFAKETPETKEVGRMMFTNCFTSTVKLVKRLNEGLGEKLEAGFPLNDVHDILGKLSKSTDKTSFPCIIHGDFWVNNIMIKYENGDRTKPVDLKIIDFQMTRRSNIFEELVYFILCSTTPEFRKDNYEAILRAYYDSFSGFLQDTLKTFLPIGFNRGVFINTMYELMLPGFIYMTFAIPMQLADPPDYSKMGEAAAELGVDLSPPPIPNGEENKENAGPPPDLLALMAKQMKLRNHLLYKQLDKSPRGVERMMNIVKELVALRLI